MSQQITEPFGLGASAPDGKVLYLPLHSVSADAFIFDVAALVELKQTYTNPAGNGRLTAARYVFPIPANAAVCSFKMQDSTGRTVTGVVKEKEKAKKEFQAAVDKGKFAGLAQEVSGDVFSISVGAIPPGGEINIFLSYSMDIPENESEMMNQIRFALPTFIGQRYGPAPAELSQAASDASDARFSFSATIRLTTSILAVSSPSHASDIVVQEPQLLPDTGRNTPLFGTTVTLRGRGDKPFSLDRDFVLSIQAERLDYPRCIAEVDEREKTVALLMTLVPRLGAPDVEAQEYVFVVDRSGSMTNENRIEYAKDALKHLMKGLPTKETYFNIVSFGNHHSSLWPRSVAYSRENVMAAITHINTMSANMGGTEIGGALDWVSSNRMSDKPTAVFVLTDGQIWQPDLVIDTVRSKVSTASPTAFLRVFTLGIGNGASEALCAGLARVGNGISFMTTQSEQIKDRCSKLLRAARALPYGSACELEVDWGYETVPRAAPEIKVEERKAAAAAEPQQEGPVDFFNASVNPFAQMAGIGLALDEGESVVPSPPSVLQAPSETPNFYPGNRFLVSAILANTVQPPAKVVLEGKLPGGLPVSIPMNVAYVLNDQSRPPLLHALAARRFIRELEDGNIKALGVSDTGGLADKATRKEVAKMAIVEYGVRYNLASRFTAFVAVDTERVVADQKMSLSEKKGEEKEAQETYDDDDDDWVKDMEVKEASDDEMGFGLDAAFIPRGGPGISRLRSAAPFQASPYGGFSPALNPSAPAPQPPPVMPSWRSSAPRQKSSRRPLMLSRAAPAPASAAPAGPPYYDPSITATGPPFDKLAHQTFATAFNAVERDSDVDSFGREEHEYPVAEKRMRSKPGARKMPSGSGDTALDPVSKSFSAQAAQNINSAEKLDDSEKRGAPRRRSKTRLFGLRSRQTSEREPAQTSAGAGAGTGGGLDPLSEIADIQSFDGSFALDGQLLALLQRKKGSLGLDVLKSAMPEDIRRVKNGDTGIGTSHVVWATVLASAYMMVALADSRSVWDSLWDKAQEFVCRELGVAPFEFNRLVQVASDLLR